MRATQQFDGALQHSAHTIDGRLATLNALRSIQPYPQKQIFPTTYTTNIKTHLKHYRKPKTPPAPCRVFSFTLNETEIILSFSCSCLIAPSLCCGEYTCEKGTAQCKRKPVCFLNPIALRCVELKALSRCLTPTNSFLRSYWNFAVCKGRTSINRSDWLLWRNNGTAWE